MKAVARNDNHTRAQRLERHRRVMAYLVLRDGDAYAPLLMALESKLEEAQRNSSIRDRAERILSSLSLDLRHALAP